MGLPGTSLVLGASGITGSTLFLFCLLWGGVGFLMPWCTLSFFGVWVPHNTVGLMNQTGQLP